MSRTLGILCAGALVLATAGCTLDSFFLSLTGSASRKEQTVALSVDQVKASLRTTLGNSGIVMVSESRDGEAVYLKGKTPNGKEFKFVLQRQKSDNADRTLVAFEGDKEAETLLWGAAIMSIMQPPPAPQQQLPVGGFPDSNSGRLPYDRIHGGIQ
jgi:hypothetical protein